MNGAESLVRSCRMVAIFARCGERGNPRRATTLRGSSAGIVGHAGDGNFHVAFMPNPNEPKEMAEAERLNQRLFRRELSLGGTRAQASTESAAARSVRCSPSTGRP